MHVKDKLDDDDDDDDALQCHMNNHNRHYSPKLNTC